MKAGRIRILAAALALAAATPAAPALAQTAQATAAHAAHDVDVERVVSPGGIEAWLVSDSTVPIITLRAYWLGGSAMEPQALLGVTSVMADMLTEGAGRYDANAFKERLEELNMSLGFGAGWDGVALSLTTLTENRDAAFEMARLALAVTRFDEAPLARIKRQLEVGIRARETSPAYIANLALESAIIPGHP
ncbi:MAG: M16 family metallopeptidase [Hyphomonadaceae bacterium]